MNGKFVMVYLTAKNEKEALAIARALVEERLAACVNLLGKTRSIYRWQGRIADEREVAFMVKTRKTLLPALTARVKKLHSYECPCIVALPIVGGSDDFLEWLDQETKKIARVRR